MTTLDSARAALSPGDHTPAPGLMADALPVLIAYVDAQVQFRFNNAAFQNWFGAEPSALSGQPLDGFYGPDKYRELRPWIDAALSGQQVTFETTFVLSDGRTISAQVIHVPQVGAGGKAVGFYAVVTDISGIRRSQEALSRSEALYHSLVDQLPLCVIQKDLEGHFTFVNSQFTTFTGKSSAEVLGRSDFDLFPAELAKKYREDDLNVQRSGQVFEAVERHELDTNGGLRFVQVFKSPVLDSDRSVVGTQVLFWDISEKHAAESALKESTAMKRAIFDSALDCIVIVDQRGLIADANRSTLRVFGYGREELIGKNMDDTLFPPVLKERTRANRENYEASREEGSMLGKRVEVPAMKKDGRMFDVEMAMQPIPCDGRTVFAMFLHDITERKKAEEEIAQKNRDLETLLYVTSHDLREPLRAIRGFSQLLVERVGGQLGETESGYLQRVIDSSERLDHLIEDVLMLSRAQRASDGIQPVDSSLVVADVLRGLEMRMEDTQAKVIAADNLPKIRVDPRWLRQSLFNLVANALKFTREGESPDIEICRYEPGPHDEQPWVGLIVRDRGMGVPEDQRERVFQLFQRAVSRKVEGTGAGLAIVRQVANRYGGNAWIEPRDGGGSEFFITFAK